jgi:hypothetical protein
LELRGEIDLPRTTKFSTGDAAVHILPLPILTKSTLVPDFFAAGKRLAMAPMLWYSILGETRRI